jgi:foldase protein PrsA
MIISRLFLLPALLVALLVTGCGGGSDADDVPKDAVAVVDGREIPRTDFDELVDTAKKSYKAQKRDFPEAGSEEYQTLRNQIVQQLVQQVELEQAAEEMDIKVTDADIDKRLDQITKQYYGGDKKKLDKALADQKLTLEQVRESISNQMLSERIYNEVTKDVKVTDADVQEFYEKNKAQYQQAESREVRHILVKTKAKATEIRAQLTPNGSNFAALARQHTQDPGSKATGGKLTISRGQTVSPFDKVAFALDRNEISQPVKTEFGFHIIQPISAIKEATTTPLKEVEASIRQNLLQTKKNETMTAWVEDLKSDYEDKVAYAVGFNPPPAATATTGTTTSAG